MMKIPKDQLLESLKMGYEEVRDCIANGHDEVDIAHVKGFCVTMEQILSIYGKATKEEMLAIKTPIIGNMSLRRKETHVIDKNNNYETPTIFRKKGNLKLHE